MEERIVMDNQNEKDMSLSKQRKLERKEAIKRQKRNSVLIKVIITLVIVAILGLAGWGIGSSIYKKAHAVTASADFSSQITADGRIKDVTASDIVTLCDYNSISAPLSEIEYSDASVEEDINNTLDQHKELSTETTAAVADGDKVSIDFVGTCDGTEFSGGTGTDYDLTIGSGQFVDNFEEQLIGHKIGDQFDVNVTFPENYDNADLAGKPATFAVSLKGIYVRPEFTDEFVAANLSEHASTVEEYKTYLKDTNYKTNLSKWLQDYLTENCTVSKYPSAYMDMLKANYKYQEEYSYQYMVEMYTQYMGQAPYKTFDEYLLQTYSMNEQEYDESLDEKVEPNAKLNLIFQAIAEKENITASLDEYKTRFLENGGTEEEFATALESYGEGYFVMSLVCDKVLDLLESKVNVL